MAIKHKFLSNIPDGLDPTLIKPSNWNEDHVVDFDGLAKSVGGVLLQAVPGTDYLTPNGSGSQLTGITATQVGLGNVTNESKTTMFTSPTFTGTPVAPTAAVNSNSTQLATCEFVLAQAGTATPLAPAVTAVVGTATKFAREDHKHPTNFTSTATDIKMNGTQAVGTSVLYPRADHVHPTDTSRAPLASPAFTGTVTAPQFSSTVVSGTAPFSVVSNTMVENLNAQYLGGTQLSGLVDVASNQTIIGNKNFSGNIGIGAINSTYKINVEYTDTAAQSISSYPLQLCLYNPSTNANTTAGITFLNGSLGTSRSAIEAVHTNDNYCDLAFKTEHNDSFTEKLRVFSDGKLGVGYAPVGAVATLDVRSLNAGYAETVAQFGNYTAKGLLKIGTTDAGALVWDIGVLNTRYLTFSTNQTERVRVMPTGAVLINTVTPQGTASEKLEVKGNVLVKDSVNAQTVRVETGLSTGYAGLDTATDSTSLGILRTHGSAHASVLWGTNIANSTFIGNNGASCANLFVGTIAAAPIRFGTNDTERMQITATGSLLVGRTAETTVPKLQVSFGNPAASPAYTAMVDIATFSAGSAGVVHVQAPTTSGIGFSSDTVRSAGYVGYTHATNLMEFRTNQTACMWLASGGLLSLGTQGDATDVLTITKTIGATNSAGIRSVLTQSVGDTVSNRTFGADIRSYSTHTSGTISNQYGVRTVARATGGGGEVAALYGFYAQVDAPSGTPNVTTAVGLYINDITIPATTSVVGVQSQISAGTGKWNIYSGGTAANYFAGNTLFGSAVQTTGAERVQITSSTLALSVKADTADTARLWRPISSASAAAGRLVFGAWDASSVQADYASVGAAIEVNTASAHAGALLFNVAAAGTIAEQMRLTSAGRLILGLTADPGYTSRLHVEGGISLNNVDNANSRVIDYYLESSFTATATGMTTSPTGTVKYTRSGNIVVLELPSISGTSNATTFTLIGMPTALRPAANKDFFVRVKDNGAAQFSMGLCTIGVDGVLNLFPTVNGGTWTSSNTKAVGTISVSYTLQ